MWSILYSLRLLALPEVKRKGAVAYLDEIFLFPHYSV